MIQTDIFDFLNDDKEENEEVSFSEQVDIFKKELIKVFDYIELEEVHRAKLRMYEKGEVIDQDIITFVLFASYVGTLKRLCCYKYVFGKGFDVRALADASVLILMFNDVYRFEFEPFMNRKEVKKELEKTRWPEWTKIGLIGTDTKNLIKQSKAFNEYRESL